MKLFILLFSLLAVCYTESPIGGYQELDVVEAKNSPEILNLIQFGLDAIVQNAIKKGLFSNTNFALTKINKVEEQVVNGENYRFDCEFADETGVKIKAKFVVYENPTKTIRTVMSYSYKVYSPSNPGTPNDGFTKVNPSEFVKAKELEGLFQLGLKTVLGKITSSGKIPEGSVLTHAKILSIYKKAVRNGEIYKFNCTTTNRVNITINVTFQVLHQVRDFVYDVEIIPPTPVNSTDPDNSTDPIDPTDPNNNTTIPDNSTNPSNNTGNSTTPTKVYEQLDLALIDENEEIKKAFDFGVNGVLQKGHEQGKIPVSDYRVTERLKLVRLNLTNGLDYIFTVRIANSANTVRIFTNFTIYVRYSTRAMTLPSYYYHYTISKDFVPSQPNNDTNTPTPNENNTTVPDTGSDNNSTNTTEPDTDTGSGSSNNSTSNTTEPSNPLNSTGSKYVEVDDEEIAQSQEIESVLDFGINEVIQIGIKQGKIPTSEFNVSQIESVTRKVNKGKNTYKCKVALVNAEEVKLKMSFTVIYNNKTQAKELFGYSYKVSNFKIN